MKIKIILVIICISSILTVTFLGFLSSRTRPSEDTTENFSAMMKLLSAQAGDVYFMYLGNNPSDHAAYDAMINMCENRPQIEYYYTVGDSYVDSHGYPRPNVITHGNTWFSSVVLSRRSV